jgi:demethylmenaquinone methyltransferase/2-methoxy-6-polyprenyl-1,4-benzoquinol methylase
MSQQVLPLPEQKAAYVREMFGRIARRYDLMNRLMTLGWDQAWRRYTVKQLDSEFKMILDVATGTGDLALEVVRQFPDAQVVGVDLTVEMLALARHKAAGQPSIRLVTGDALCLPFPDASFDGIVTGFALRNVTDIPAAFAEMARVARPGARLACLEIAKPQSPLVRRLFQVYFYHIVPPIGGLISGQPEAYTYLPHSLTAFLTPAEIAVVMRRTGWTDVSYRSLMFGTAAVHRGTRL